MQKCGGPCCWPLCRGKCSSTGRTPPSMMPHGRLQHPRPDPASLRPAYNLRWSHEGVSPQPHCTKPKKNFRPSRRPHHGNTPITGTSWGIPAKTHNAMASTRRTPDATLDSPNQRRVRDSLGWLDAVPDPEIPAISSLILGIIRDVQWSGDTT